MVARFPDQPWMIARMNKLTYALALGAGLVLSLAGPSADAAPILQNLPTPELSAAQFNSLFRPIASAPVMTHPYQFLNTPESGNVVSQVFEGTGPTAGLYAYAYQIAVNNVLASSREPTSVNSASMVFNATPTKANLNPADPTSQSSAVYVVKNGKVGSIDPPQAAPGDVVQTPISVAWLPGAKTGSLTFQYLDATSNRGPLQAGSSGGTLVVLSTQPFGSQPVSIQNPEPQIVYPTAYSPQSGMIQQVPAPEPATVLAWAGMIGATALARRVRRSHASA
jgi:hypothetical protein